MLKTISAIFTAAIIAGVATLASAPTSGPVAADTLPQQAEAELKSCTQRPWPYYNCVGTTMGNPKIRLVTTERLASE